MKSITTLKGNWKTTKGKLIQRFANLINNDSLYREGLQQEIKGRAQTRLGKTKTKVKNFFHIQY